MEFIYRPVPSFIRRGVDGVKELIGGIIFSARCELHFVREHENLVKHPRNNKCITIGQSVFCTVPTMKIKYEPVLKPELFHQNSPSTIYFLSSFFLHLSLYWKFINVFNK